MTPLLEELLRETLERLGRQEQRTAAIEAALLSAPASPPAGVAADPLTQTPAVRAGETHSGTPLRREPAAAGSPGSAVSPAAVLSSLDDVVWSVSPDGQFVFFIGGAVERIYGLTEHDLQDHRGRWLDAVPAEDRERLRAALARLPDADAFTLEHRVAHRAGGFRWVVARGKLVRDRDGRPLRVDGATADVTRRARTREAIVDVLSGVGPASGADFLAKLPQHLCAAQGARAAAVVEPHPHDTGAARVAASWVGGRAAGPVALAAAPLVRELLSGGRAFARDSARERYPADPLVLQLRAEAIAAEPLVDERGELLGSLVIADDRPFAESDPRALLRALAPRVAVELARSREAPGPQQGAPSARLAEAVQRAGEAERVLLSAANLAAAGRMAAGLAHDFNNLLGVISGNAELIRESLPEGDARRETAEVIAQTAQSIAGMNRKLLALGKSGTARVEPLDAANAIRILEPLLRRLTGRRVALGFDLAPGLPLLAADATQFERVIINLVLNARDAVEAAQAPGTITVRAALATVEEGRPGWPAGRPAGQFVAITVADSGCGMPAEVRAKMFDLFFTTKGDRGTGLGLATVQEIVTAAQGHIEVESEPGWGTQVRVYWPPAEAPLLKIRG